MPRGRASNESVVASAACITLVPLCHLRASRPHLPKFFEKPFKVSGKTMEGFGRNVPWFLESGCSIRIPAPQTGGKRFTEHFEKVHRSFAKSTKNFSWKFIVLFQKPFQCFLSQKVNKWTSEQGYKDGKPATRAGGTKESYSKKLSQSDTFFE